MNNTTQQTQDEVKATWEAVKEHLNQELMKVDSEENLNKFIVGIVGSVVMGVKEARAGMGTGTETGMIQLTNTHNITQPLKLTTQQDYIG